MRVAAGWRFIWLPDAELTGDLLPIELAIGPISDIAVLGHLTTARQAGHKTLHRLGNTPAATNPSGSEIAKESASSRAIPC